jgi:hypothetical protein
MGDTVTCAICQKTIDPLEERFADFDRMTKAQRHVHRGCMSATQTSSAFTSPIHRLTTRLRRLFGGAMRFDSV